MDQWSPVTKNLDRSKAVVVARFEPRVSLHGDNESNGSLWVFLVSEALDFFSYIAILRFRLGGNGQQRKDTFV